MKARVVSPYGYLYYGEVFINGDWEVVTDSCLTIWGAKRLLKKYKRGYKKKNNRRNIGVIKEFDL